MDIFLYEDTGIDIGLNDQFELALSNQNSEGNSVEKPRIDDLFIALEDDDDSDFARIFAPTPGIEGPVLGSGG